MMFPAINMHGGQAAISSLTAGVLRIPSFTISVVGVALIGEVVRRVLVDILESIGMYNRTNKLAKTIDYITPQMLKDVQNVIASQPLYKQCAIGVGCCIVGLAGCAFTEFFFGIPSPLYGRVFAAISPFQLSNQNPLVNLVSFIADEIAKR